VASPVDWLSFRLWSLPAPPRLTGALRARAVSPEFDLTPPAGAGVPDWASSQHDVTQPA